MKADGALIHAAGNLGRSRIPGDTSEIFNKQYEGLIAYNQAKWGTIGKAIGGAANIAMGVEKLMEKQEVEPLSPQERYPQNYNPDGTPKTFADWEEEQKKKQRQAGGDDSIIYDENITGGFTGISDHDRIMSMDVGGGDTDSPVEYSPFKSVEEKTSKINTNNIRKQNSSPTTQTQQSTETLPSTREMDNAIESMVTDLAVQSIASNAGHYNGGGGLSEAHFEAADNALRAMKDDLYALINLKNPTLEDKKQQNLLQRKTNTLRQNIVGIKGLIKQTSQAYSENLVNPELSFKGRPNEQVLLKQIMDPKADLKKLGITAFWKDEELYYEYGPSQIFMEYANNKGLKISDEELMAQEKQTIRASSLLSMAILKDTKSENDINSVINKAGDDAIATIGNTKDLLNSDFSRIETEVETGFRSILENPSANLQDLFTRDLMIGRTKRNYKKDLELNPEINALTYTNLGLTNSVDVNRDGVISSDELSQDDVAVIIETLTNPQTSEQKKAAIETFVNTYLKPLAAQEFNYMRGQISGEKTQLAQDLIAKYSKA